MTVTATSTWPRRSIAVRNHAVPLLQAYAVAVMVFPSEFVLKAVGGGGYLAALIGFCMFLAWVASTLLGMHNPLEYRSPVRIALAGMWLVSLASYALINRTTVSTTALTGADRWLLQLVGVSGVILVASEYLRSLDDVKRVLRALVWGGAFCGLVAAMQFWLRLDITPYLKLPGFSFNSADGFVGIGTRGGIARVPGTSIDPIELGVTAAMLLPLAVYLAVYDVKRSRIARWLPVFGIAVCIPTSVSRAAILGSGVALGTLIASLPPTRRLGGITGIGVAVAGVFLTAHGLIGTLKQYFLAGTADASIEHRVNNYAYVEQQVKEAPFFGHGGGTYFVQSIHILDNQYLTTAVELGLVGVCALLFYLLWPAVTAFAARGRTTQTELRDLCAALAGAELAAVLCSGTFDSLSFPMFVSVQALVVGLIGAAWLLASGPGEDAVEVQRSRPHISEVFYISRRSSS